MYEFIRGQITSKSPTSVVIANTGIGFRAEVSLRTSERTPPVGRTATLLVHHRVQDDQQRLFGFVDESERSLFRRLIAVAGIGPAHALALLSAHSPDQIWNLIQAGDARGLAKAKGIGPKIAQRICTELGDVVERRRTSGVSEEQISKPMASEEAIAALMVLGYTESQAAKTIESAAQELGQDAATEELVRVALKKA